MKQEKSQSPSSKDGSRTKPTVSRVFEDGTILELLYQQKTYQTAFAVWKDGTATIKDRYKLNERTELVPYSPTNNLIRNQVILFPSKPDEYGTIGELVVEVQSFIRKYLDVSDTFLKIASYYVLFSWIYDDFNELAYLRAIGDFGSGKTRFLHTVGSLCYKPIFASGATTVAPIFHILERFRGTLCLDEADFSVSTEKAEIIKILNNGNGKGMSVLRMVASASGNGEYTTKSYNVFSPKLIAARGYNDDRALESRCLTEEMGQRSLRNDIPINLPSSYRDEALQLRNKLLMFRFRNLGQQCVDPSLVDRTLEPRLNQIFVPLLSIIDDQNLRNEIRSLARQYQRDMVTTRGFDVEAQLLEVIYELSERRLSQAITIKAIVELFTKRFGDEYENKVTNRWIGYLIRTKLKLKTHKSNGVFVIPTTQMPLLHRLYERYGITMPRAPEVTNASDETSSKALDKRDFRDTISGSHNNATENTETTVPKDGDVDTAPDNFSKSL